jgi:hypothetical protein
MALDGRLTDALSVIGLARTAAVLDARPRARDPVSAVRAPHDAHLGAIEY